MQHDDSTPTTDRVREIRHERLCSLQEAKKIAWREEAHRRLATATTIDDLRPLLATLIEKI